MRILWRRPEPSVMVRKWLLMIATHVQFSIIFPLAFGAIMCYPFVLSLRDAPRPCILSHQAAPPLDASIAYMRQAIFIPPVFVSAFDPKITEIVAPMKIFHEDLKASNSSARLFSLYDPDTPPISQFVAPTSPNVQGLLFTFVYEDIEQAALWETALETISKGKAPKTPPSHLVDRGELKEAELTTTSSAPYSPWPGASWFSQFSVAALALAVTIYSFLWVYTTTAYRPWVFVLCTAVRIILGISSAISVVSFLYPAFNTWILSRFLWIIIMAVVIGISQSLRIIDIAEGPLANSQTALNRLIIAYQNSFKSIVVVVWVQVLLGALATLCLYFPTQPALLPLTAFMIVYIAIDIVLHYTFFAAVTYINFVGLDTDDFSYVERPYSRRKSSLRRIYDAQLTFFQQKMARHIGYVVYFPVVFYLVLHYNGGYFLNQIHPNIKHALSQPEYIDSFVNPLDEALNGYSFLEIFRPVVFDINGHFDPPPGRITFTISTLRYGNTFSMILEMFCLKIFVSSLCMIAVLLLTDQKTLSHTVHGLNADREGFHELTIDVKSQFDLIKISTDDLWISVLGLDGALTVVDFTSMTVEQKRLSQLPLVQNPWGVEGLVLNSRDGVVATLYRSQIDLWNIASGKQYYKLDYSKVLNAPPLATTFINTTLLFISDAGRLIEAYTTKPPQIYALLPKTLRWAIFSSQIGNSGGTNAVLCDIENELYLCKRTDGTQAQWSLAPLQLSTTFLVSHDISDVDPNCTPSFRGMLPIPVAWTEEYQESDDIISALSVPDIQIWIAFTATKVMFIDLISGVILQIAEFGTFKPGTARVFHSQPTHCAFCGSTALSSLTIAYESSANEGELVCQTWKISNKSRNSICLRIERDPHETRCHGFTQTEVTTVRLGNVKTWAPTKINMIMGLRAPEGLDDFNQSWEAFAISTTTGVTTEFPLDEHALDSQLLTSSPGQATPLGAKSVCIPFGNTLKILYLER